MINFYAYKSLGILNPAAPLFQMQKAIWYAFFDQKFNKTLSLALSTNLWWSCNMELINYLNQSCFLKFDKFWGLIQRFFSINKYRKSLYCKDTEVYPRYQNRSPLSFFVNLEDIKHVYNIIKNVNTKVF